VCGTSSVQYERVNGGSSLEVILSCKPLVHTQTVVVSLIGLSEIRSHIELCRRQTVVSGFSILLIILCVCVCVFVLLHWEDECS
jgi:hypothetical protein